MYHKDCTDIEDSHSGSPLPRLCFRKWWTPSCRDIHLEHTISANGIKATLAKVDAIINAPAPRNSTELHSFLGLVNYYGKYVANLSTVLHPLNNLLKADTKWKWDATCSKAFTQAKAELASAQMLTHFDPQLPIRLAADASSYGVGAVVSHILPDGSERPIAFASRSLSSSEKNYAQIEREALSLVFGVKKYHQYLYGSLFSLLIINLLQLSLDQKRVFQPCQLHVFRDGLFSCQPMITTSFSSQPSSTAMLTDYLVSPSQPASLLQTMDVRPVCSTLDNFKRCQLQQLMYKRVQEMTRSSVRFADMYRRDGHLHDVSSELQAFKSRQESKMN